MNLLGLNAEIAELRQDLADARRDREKLLDTVLTGDPAEAAASRDVALAVNDVWIRRYERNLTEALAQADQAGDNRAAGDSSFPVSTIPSACASAEIVELPVCWCGHYERDHAPGGYGNTARDGCVKCPCDGYTGP